VKTPPLVLKNETLKNVKNLTGTYLSFENSKFDNVTIDAAKDTMMISLINCSFTNSAVDYRNVPGKVSVTLKNCTGSLQEKGSIGRKIK
jgi:hypothetical protein